MKILILHRYFWPQPYPYAQMLKDIVERLSVDHTVSVLTTDSGSLEEKHLREKWSEENLISITALPLGSEKRVGLFRKAINSLYFGVWVIYKLSASNADTVMVATTPPIVIAMIVRWVSFIKKFKYVYHCQDIHPEAMLLGGNIKKNLLFRLLKNIDKKNINSAWKVITLSEDMRATLKKRGCKVSHVNLINNFIFESGEVSPTATIRNKVNFLFAGSLGRLQNLTLLMDSLALLKHRQDLQFTFMGDGVMYKEMQSAKEKNELDNVRFLGQRSLEEAIKAMKIADIGIVSIANNITQVAYPSKTMMYLGNGLPVLALVDKQTELYEFINNKEIGVAVEPVSSDLIANAIEQFADQVLEKPIDKNHVQNVAQCYFGKAIILKKFLTVFS